MTDILIKRTGKDQVCFEALTEKGLAFQNKYGSCLYDETNMIAASLWAESMKEAGLDVNFICNS